MAQVFELKPRTDQSDLDRAQKLYDDGKYDDAYMILDKLLVHDPMNPPALVVMSAVLKKMGRIALAYPLAKLATQLRPDKCEAWIAQGHSEQLLWRLDESEASYRKALARAQTKQHKATCTNNLCSIYLDRGDFEGSEPLARKSLEFEDDPQAHHNLALALLAQRKWREAWPNYSGSMGTVNRLTVKYTNPPEPVWDGSKDKTVVISGEQGLGDEICAASMIPDAIRDSKRVIIDCDKRLAGLFKRSFPNATVHGTRWEKQLNWPKEDREIDASISGFEIAKFYRNEESDFPGTPYLVADPDRVAMWKGLWKEKRKPVIGLAWTGGIWHTGANHRKLDLDELKPLFNSIDAHWVSLQYKDASKEIEGSPVVQYPFATLTKDYDDTAALVASCDLVIGIHTSVMHLAGALGVPTWIMVPKQSQWRYGQKYDDMSWYKSVKLYRQTDRWPLKRMAEDLKERFK